MNCLLWRLRCGKAQQRPLHLKWYTKGQEPPPFLEEATAGKLFQTRVEQGETAFYRSITRADGIVLIGGAISTKIVGQVAIGSRIPILCLRDFGGGPPRS